MRITRSSITISGLAALVAGCGTQGPLAPDFDEERPPRFLEVRGAESIVLGRAPAALTAVLANPGGTAATGIGLRVSVEQGAHEVSWGTHAIRCDGSVPGTLPVTGCATDVTVEIDAEGEGAGFVHGPATVRLELVAGSGDGAVVLDEWLRAVSLVGIRSGSGTARVDGVLDAAEWADAVTTPVTIAWPDGVSRPGEILVMNDATNIYFAVRMEGDARALTWSAIVEIDPEARGGGRHEGEDALVVNWRPTSSPRSALYDDYTTGACCAPDDTRDGGTVDGGAAHGVGPWEAVAEFWHPLASADRRHDMQVGSGDVISIAPSVRLLSPTVDTRLPEVWLRIG